ncbi:hypothetical protein AK812_SmicGene43799 [Symbiodinium microadriaticum]|uniref:Reverse transcriptase Ty1/copia-type domain-containing protein n=1 Tax=Symbiodinium microadriaticum TaxID=2951 RepID=A0A1Q9C040_SYMMI|nr:hypothetical protein AK812_SmicGene43799 [Symbiodinium microadriaticum]
MEDAPKNDQGESPPEVSPEELDSMDQEAAVEELNRLSKIGVIEEFAKSGASGSEKRMDLREVHDWRCRDGKWRRRCRIVAREYRAGATSTAETFSPTASNAAARLVLILHLLNPTWVILVLDIKDAYLQVPQQEEVLVTISDWMKKDSEKTVYGLSKNWRKYSKWKKKEDNDEIPPEESHVVEAYSDSDWGSLKTPEKDSESYSIVQLRSRTVRENVRTEIRYEQEKKLKEYVSSGQVKEEGAYSQQPGSTDAVEEAKYSSTEVAMVVTVLLLVIPYVWMAVKRIHSEWTRIMMIGTVGINSSSKNYIFHRTTCRYVQGKARNGYFIHLDYDVAVEQGYRPCYVCFPEAKKMQKQTDEDDEWELTSESTETTESDGCPKKCTWCKIRKCTRKKPDHVHCSCTVCIQKYTEDLWRGQYDKVPESSSSTQGPTGRKGSGALEYMPPHVNTKGNRPTGQGGKSGKRGRAAMEPVAEERNEPTVPEQDGSLTQGTPEVEEQPPTYEDMYDMVPAKANGLWQYSTNTSRAKCGSIDCRLIGPFGSVNPREASSFCAGEVCTAEDREKCCSDARYSKRFMLVMAQPSRTTTASTARVKGLTVAGDDYDTDTIFTPNNPFYITRADQWWQGQLTVPLVVPGNEEIRITQLCLTMTHVSSKITAIAGSVLHLSSVKVLNTEGSKSVEIAELTGWAQQGPRVQGYTDKPECKTVD